MDKDLAMELAVRGVITREDLAEQSIDDLLDIDGIDDDRAGKLIMAEVSLAIAGVAADSLSSMIPGLLGAGAAQGMLNGQRERLMEQIGSDLDNTLLYVYRGLSDPELEEFSTFAESPEGKAYYQAALAAIRAGLAVGQSLTPAPPEN